MFQLHSKLTNPEVIIAVTSLRNGVDTFERKHIPGVWYRVFPNTQREVMALRLLDHRVDKYAPAEDNGALISESAFEQLKTARP